MSTTFYFLVTAEAEAFVRLLQQDAYAARFETKLTPPGTLVIVHDSEDVAILHALRAGWRAGSDYVCKHTF